MTDILPRILVIAPQPFYQDRGTPIALLHTTRAMVRAGFDVDVVTFKGGTDPDYAGIRVFRAESRLSSPNLPIGLSWRKIVQHFALYRLTEKMLRQNRYVAIHAVEEGVITARVLTRLSNIPIVYDMHSWLSDELSTLPILGHWPAIAMIRAIERRIVCGVNTVFCSLGLGAAAKSLHESENATEWLFPVQQPPLDESQNSSIRSRYGISTESELIVYTGNLTRNQNIGLFLEAISLLLATRATTEVAIVGATGNDADKLRRKIEPSLLSRIHIIERVPRNCALELMACADIAVSPRVRGLNAPLKLFDYVGAGIPVVATDVPAHRVVLGSAAEYCEPVARDVADAIARLLDDASRCEEIRVKYAELSRDVFSEGAFNRTVSNVYSHLLGDRIAALTVST
ncbi:MAG: glycosyltransferase [Gammaproteobacteria bacterium]|nr:glycosyltransferase [Gammaproteobacteria bacterium]MBU2676741.1 glycosyltransferase [Gammaproteobacteria bacterium]NNC57833.1 glycosyltransferase [Woeseiaceae bacterium]NNL50476.1 glycosyltransferase [Woeseiaceae bacterium]